MVLRGAISGPTGSAITLLDAWAMPVGRPDETVDKLRWELTSSLRRPIGAVPDRVLPTARRSATGSPEAGRSSAGTSVAQTAAQAWHRRNVAVGSVARRGGRLITPWDTDRLRDLERIEMRTSTGDARRPGPHRLRRADISAVERTQVPRRWEDVSDLVPPDITTRASSTAAPTCSGRTFNSSNGRLTVGGPAAEDGLCLLVPGHHLAVGVGHDQPNRHAQRSAHASHPRSNPDHWPLRFSRGHYIRNQQ
jgi:hypothetical protein